MAKKYREPFSKGVLARSLTRAEMDPNKAYTFSSQIEAQLKKEGVKLIKLDDLVNVVRQRLKEEDSEVAVQYGLWKRIRKCQDSGYSYRGFIRSGNFLHSIRSGQPTGNP